MSAAPSPQSGTLPEGQVRAMFDRIAGIYDRLNTVMTAGLDRQWRRRAADLAAVGSGDRVLDVACGTGELSVELARRVAPGGQVIGCDFSEAMLDLAREKVAALQREPVAVGHGGAANGGAGAPADGVAANGTAALNGSAPGGDPASASSVRFEWADALALPYPDDAFDAATVGFGARNFSDLDRGLAELARVVRPGGRVVILEMTTPRKPPLSWFFSTWFDRVVPLLGRLGGDADAYTYLPNSVKRFPGPEALGAAFERAGLGRIRWIITGGGIIALHVGEKERA